MVQWQVVYHGLLAKIVNNFSCSYFILFHTTFASRITLVLQLMFILLSYILHVSSVKKIAFLHRSLLYQVPYDNHPDISLFYTSFWCCVFPLLSNQIVLVLISYFFHWWYGKPKSTFPCVANSTCFSMSMQLIIKKGFQLWLYI